MKRKFAAFGATLLLVLAVVGFSGGVPALNERPAQAWAYTSCTAVEMNGWRWCYKSCGSMEKWIEPNCNTWVRVSIWNA